MTKPPLAVLAFNRPQYLKRTLESLAEQSAEALRGREIHLFQDGIVNKISGRQYSSPSVAEENIHEFLKLFPKGFVHLQGENLGIARHFDFVEKHFFELRCLPAAIFLEDDMVLSPHYLGVMDNLIEFALRNEKVGYVAAYGNHKASLQEQLRNPSGIIEMDHKWAFALTRRQWNRQKPFLSEYLELIAATDYQMRDHRKIVEWMISKGAVVPGTSQDGIKDIALHLSGAVKLNTYCCFGKYIGQKGVHSTEQTYRAGGYEFTDLHPEPIKNFDWPSEAELERIINNNRKSLVDNVGRVEQLFSFYRGP